MAEARFEINGQGYFALTQGDPDKPLLLFLHGFPEYSGAWAELLTRLSDSFYCVAPDQRGYGQSWRPTEVEHYQMPNLVRDAAAMIQYFGRGQAHAVIAHDWGAGVGYALAMRLPQLVEHLIIINGVHPIPFQNALASGKGQSAASQYMDWLRAEGSEDALAKDDFDKLLNLFADKMDMSWMTPERAKGYKAAWRDAEGVRGMVNWYRASPLKVAKPGAPLPSDVLPVLDPNKLRVSMRHLLLWGMRDTALLPETRAGLEDLCDDLTQFEHPTADHWITHQHPEWLETHIRAFLTVR